MRQGRQWLKCPTQGKLSQRKFNFFQLLKTKSPVYLSYLKAAGLGYTDVAREILDRCPATVAAQDNEGKSPLHYAAALKDDGVMYDLLTEHGADESKLDNVSTSRLFVIERRR